MRKHIPLQSLFFLVGEEITHCPLTVPRGDTPCVTAGDARRANPWRSGEVESGEKKETSQPAPTVPGGDTPCVTAGDARRVNSWRSEEVKKWRGRMERERKKKPPSLHPLSPEGTHHA